MLFRSSQAKPVVSALSKGHNKSAITSSTGLRHLVTIVGIAAAAFSILSMRSVTPLSSTTTSSSSLLILSMRSVTPLSSTTTSSSSLLSNDNPSSSKTSTEETGGSNHVKDMKDPVIRGVKNGTTLSSDMPKSTIKTKPRKKNENVISPAVALDRSRKTTDAGVDISDPSLYDEIDLNGDSSTATVMGIATGYDLRTYQQFVGSLRNSGYKGHIILGVSPDVPERVLNYFQARNVTPKKMKWVDCTYRNNDEKGGKIFAQTKCSHPYPDIKIRWSRFPLARDWLQECTTCTGPVLVMDVRDSIFQLDPFGPGSPPVKGLQVFEEHKSQRTLHWVAQWPIQECKGIIYNETMLCSGTIIGTRTAMLKYLEIMYAEMEVWISDPKCRFDMNGDDQSMHNYLFYSGQIPFATAWANRAGGIVNTVGVEGSNVFNSHRAEMMKQFNLTKGPAGMKPYPGAEGRRWIGKQYNLTDDEGFFTEADGSRSRVIHQYDRLGDPYFAWMRGQAFLRDDWTQRG